LELSRPDVLAAIAARDRGALRDALANGGDPEQRGPGGEPVLSQAARTGDADLVAALLDAGAAVEAASACGNTALMEAAARGHLDVVKLLLARGARPTRRNKWGLGADDWAKWPENSAEIQAELGARGG
jgi:ankyrin repeat protein